MFENVAPAECHDYAPRTQRQMDHAADTLANFRQGGLRELSRLLGTFHVQEAASRQVGFGEVAGLCREMKASLSAMLRGRQSVLTGLLQLERHCATIAAHAEAVAAARVPLRTAE